tara:strand:- start:71 stop:283 length:213 start_codon:yes stop_codon:yes gene_type:complete
MRRTLTEAKLESILFPADTIEKLREAIREIEAVRRDTPDVPHNQAESEALQSAIDLIKEASSIIATIEYW